MIVNDFWYIKEQENSFAIFNYEEKRITNDYTDLEEKEHLEEICKTHNLSVLGSDYKGD